MTVFCVHSVIDQPQTETSGVVCQCRRHVPSITYKITPVTLLQPARRAAVLGQPSSLRPHCSHTGSEPNGLLPKSLPYYRYLALCMRQLIKAEGHRQSSKMFFVHLLRQKIDFFCIIYASSMGFIENCGKELVFYSKYLQYLIYFLTILSYLSSFL
jgi:hypothetical protein